MTKAKPKEEHKKNGRPSGYRAEYAVSVGQWCKEGLTDQEIANRLQISIQTFHNWKHQHPEFLEALKTGKAVADERVERSLFHRAVGYTFESEEIFQHKGKIIRAKVMKHVPPDTTSMIFWLKNRRKEAWRDVQSHEIGRAGEFSQLTDAELAQRLVDVGKQMLLGAPVDGEVIEHEEAGDEPGDG